MDRAGGVEFVTHDYVRHSTTTLFAALDVATGAVIAACKPRHRHQEFLSFLRRIDKEVPKDIELNLIVDNYCTYKHAKVKAWLAQRSRFHVYYIHPSMHPDSIRWSAGLESSPNEQSGAAASPAERQRADRQD